MILADTSIWVEHLSQGLPEMVALLEVGRVGMHPFVLGELACGNLRNRREVLDLLATMPAAAIATEGEALAFIERHAVMGRGIGYIDVHLLASASLDGSARLWTRDRRLATVAANLNLSFAEP